MVRNEVRHVLLEEAFESVHVWLFPPPTERTADLSLELRPSDVSRAFGEAVSGLRAALAEQLTAPTVRFGSKPLTGVALASLAPCLVKTLNERDVILPQSAYESMCEAQLEVVKDRALLLAKARIAELEALGGRPTSPGSAAPADENGEPAPGGANGGGGGAPLLPRARAPAAVRAELVEAMAALRAQYDIDAAGTGAPAAALQRCAKQLDEACAALVDAACARAAEIARAVLASRCVTVALSFSATKLSPAPPAGATRSAGSSTGRSPSGCAAAASPRPSTRLSASARSSRPNASPRRARASSTRRSPRSRPCTPSSATPSRAARSRARCARCATTPRSSSRASRA